MSTDSDTAWSEAHAAADEIAEAFSELHPEIKMNLEQWSDLREMIQREFLGRMCLEYEDIGASELCSNYKSLRRPPDQTKV
jgi:hypothetical protein